MSELYEPTSKQVAEVGGTWHPSQNVILESGNSLLMIVGTITGCGLGQVRGLTSLCNIKDWDKALIVWETWIATEKAGNFARNKKGISCLIGTLGSTYYGSTPETNRHIIAIKKLGFVEYADYQNYAHSGKDRQKLFIKIL